LNISLASINKIKLFHTHLSKAVPARRLLFLLAFEPVAATEPDVGARAPATALPESDAQELPEETNVFCVRVVEYEREAKQNNNRKN
jgi:hypothetical protein